MGSTTQIGQQLVQRSSVSAAEELPSPKILDAATGIETGFCLLPQFIPLNLQRR